MKNTPSTKLIFFHSSLHKQGAAPAAGPPHRLWLLTFVSFFTLVFLITFLAMKPSATAFPAVASSSAAKLPDYLFETLLHYASSNVTNKMPQSDFNSVASVLHRLSPCNLLVFGLGFETLLWRALNHKGRTVFIDENSYYISRFEEQHKGVEAYDVQFATRVSEMQELLLSARDQIRGDCRPVQNLLFSDCRLGINDMPNQLYEVDWDVILVDGPRGYSSSSPGRMSAIFTAGVLGRSKREKKKETHVFVHDYEREVERVFSEEFLCKENMAAMGGSDGASTTSMAHFVIPSMGPDSFTFCSNKNITSGSSSSSSSRS